MDENGNSNAKSSISIGSMFLFFLIAWIMGLWETPFGEWTVALLWTIFWVTMAIVWGTVGIIALLWWIYKQYFEDY